MSSLEFYQKLASRALPKKRAKKQIRNPQIIFYSLEMASLFFFAMDSFYFMYKIPYLSPPQPFELNFEGMVMLILKPSMVLCF